MDLRYREHVLTVDGQFDARKEGRFRRLILGHEEFLTIFRRQIESDKGELPRWFVVEIDAVHYDIASRGFEILLVSKEFEPVPPGEQIPLFSMNRREMAVAPAERLNIDTAAGVVSLPHVEKTWEGQNAADAPSAQKTGLIDRNFKAITKIEAGDPVCFYDAGELPAGAVTQAEREIAPGVFLKPGPDARWKDAPPQMTIGVDPAGADLSKSTVCYYGPDGLIVGGPVAMKSGDTLEMRPAKSEERLALEYDLKQLLPVEPGGILDRSIQDGPDLLLSDALRRAKAGNAGDAVRYLTRAE